MWLIISWNCNGIKSKQGDLYQTINHYSPKLVFLNETRLRPNDKLKLKNYATERMDRPDNRGGGVACLIHSSIRYKRITNLQTNIEYITLEIESKLWISGGYAPPEAIRTAADIEVFFPRLGRALLIGDLNAKHTSWLNDNNNRAGQLLFNHIISRPNLLIHHPDNHTHFPSNGRTPSTLDIALTKGLTHIDLKTKDILGSDHLPLFLYWNNHPREQELQTIFSYKNFNWQEFKHRISDLTIIPNHITNVSELERQVNILTKNIQTTRDQLAPKIKMRNRTDQIPDSLKSLIKSRNQIKKAWQRRPNYLDGQFIKTLNTEIERGLRNHRNKTWMKYVSSLGTQDNSLWKLARSIRRPGAQQTDLVVDGISYYRDQDKARVFAEHFEKIFEDTQTDNETHKDITDSANTFSTQKFPIPPTVLQKILATPKELANTIKNLKNGKAPGPDTIGNNLIKNLPRKAQIQLLQITNACITLQHFPQSWKHAHVIVLPKVGKDLSLPQSYRPISLLPALGKVVEKIILSRILKVINEQESLPPEQFGFRPGHNTTLAVAKVAQDASMAFNAQESTFLVLLDIEKAFDKVWHKGLIHKIQLTHNFPSHLTSLISSYLSNRSFAIKILNTLSQPKPIKAGVPQGSVLSPTLFNLYIADIPKTPKTRIMMYADDTALYTSAYFAEDARAALKSHLELLMPYLSKWKIKLNASKTELLTLTRKRTNNIMEPPLTIENTIITPQTTAKYLGIVLDKTLRGYPQVAYTLQKAHTAEKKLYPLMKPHSFLSPENRIQIYKSIIRPTLLYGAPAWNFICTTQKNKIQRFQNKALKTALSLPRETRTVEVHRLANINTILDYFEEVSTKFFRQTSHGPTLTSNLASLRHNPLNPAKHRPIHHRLPLYYEPP